MSFNLLEWIDTALARCGKTVVVMLCGLSALSANTHTLFLTLRQMCTTIKKYYKHLVADVRCISVVFNVNFQIGSG